MAAPIPFDAPVTTATLPFSLFIWFSFQKHLCRREQKEAKIIPPKQLLVNTQLFSWVAAISPSILTVLTVLRPRGRYKTFETVLSRSSLLIKECPAYPVSSFWSRLSPFIPMPSECC